MCSPGTEAWPSGVDAPIVVAYGAHRDAFGSLWLPKIDSRLPVVVLLHGGFWRPRMSLDVTEPLAAGIARLGAAVWNVEYRRDPGPGCWRETLASIAAAVDFVPRLASRYEIDPDRTVVVGHSAGGQLALWTAMRASERRGGTGEGVTSPPTVPAAVISLAGITDMVAAAEQRLGDDAVVEFLGGSAEEYPERYQATSPRTALPLGVPQYLVHGDADQRVPFAMSADYAAAATARGDRAELVRVTGAGHLCLLDPSAPAGRHVLATIGQALGDMPTSAGREMAASDPVRSPR